MATYMGLKGLKMTIYKLKAKFTLVDDLDLYLPLTL